MQPVRRRIAEILREHGSATVAELARALEMAQVSVRHHLDILVGEDLVEMIGVRRQNGAGRPSLVYSLTPQAVKIFPQRHGALASAMLSELKSTLSSGEVYRIMQRVGETTAHEAPTAEPGRPMAERMDDVARFLSQRGYDARWEERNGHYELHACNCPYAGVSDEHPEVCSMDQAMMRSLLPEASRLQTRAIDGASRCTYIITSHEAHVDGD